MALDRALAMGLGCWEGGSRWKRASKAKKAGEVARTCATWRERTGARIELGMGWRLGPVVGPMGNKFFFFNYHKYRDVENSLVVQWLRLYAFTARALGSIPGQGTNIPQAPCVCVLVAQSYPTLCDPMDCNPPGSSVHEIFQARILEWVAISFSRGSSQPRDRTQVSCTAGRFFTD